jgi:hypothetical protein
VPKRTSILWCVMSANSNKSVVASSALIVLGILVMLAGEKYLIVLVPAAVLVWYGVAPRLRRNRN